MLLERAASPGNCRGIAIGVTTLAVAADEYEDGSDQGWMERERRESDEVEGAGGWVMTPVLCTCRRYRWWLSCDTAKSRAL